MKINVSSWSLLMLESNPNFHFNLSTSVGVLIVIDSNSNPFPTSILILIGRNNNTELFVWRVLLYIFVCLFDNFTHELNKLLVEDQNQV